MLAVVEVPDLNRAVEAARARAEQTEVLSANERRLGDRSASLFGSQAVSQEESDQRLADASAADATARVARAELARLEEQRDFATVRAPFDAVMAARNFDRGDRVRGDAATAEGWPYHLVRLDTLRFVVSATPDLALRLNATTRATLRFTDFPGQTFPAAVARSSRIFDPATGTMRVELLLENPDLALPADLTGTATFKLAPRPGTFLVPTNALVLGGGKTTLAIVNEGKVAYIEVIRGRNLGPTVEVASAALSESTAVIINPNALMGAGDVVTVSVPAPPNSRTPLGSRGVGPFELNAARFCAGGLVIVTG